MAGLSLLLLGPFAAVLDDRPLTRFRTRSVQALLIYLACQPEPHRREGLMALLWPDIAQTSAQKNLRQSLYRLRRVIPELPAREGDGSVPLLLADRQAVQINPDAAYDLDVHAFTDLLRGPQSGWPEAASLYRGDFLSDFYLPNTAPFEEWAASRRAELKRQALDTLDKLTDAAMNDRQWVSAERYARQQLAIDDLREGAHRQLMKLLALSGERGRAMAQYEHCRRLLSRELGVEPSAETRTLAEAIRAGTLVGTAAPTIAPSRGLPVTFPAFLTDESVMPPVTRPVFVARERHLGKVEQLLNEAISGCGQILFITGGAGRGKSALMAEFGRRAQDSHPDLLVATGNCNAYAGLGDPYLPFREVLGMLTGDVEASWAAGAITRDQARRLWNHLPLVIPALTHHGPYLLDTLLSGRALLSRAEAAASGDAPWLAQLRESVDRERSRDEGLEQRHLFQQFTNVLRALAAERPLLVLLDDMQWADAASISLLFHLGRRLDGTRCLVVCAYRPEEVALGRNGDRHPLAKPLAEFKRQYGDVWIDLGQVEEGEERRFVDAFLETEPNRLPERFRCALTDHAGGHALFTIELLRAMQERGDLVRDEAGEWIESDSLDWGTLPMKVEAVIEERIERLDADLREALSIASVEGETFTAQVVARVLEIGERESLQMLSQELEKRHRLVRQAGEPNVGRQQLARYRFSHALFQQYLYDDLTPAERRLLHGRVAMILESIYEGAAEQIAAHLAHHYSQAGDDRAALKYHVIAADRSLTAYAHQEAEDHYRRALSLEPTPAQRAELYSGLGMSLVRQGRETEALQAWRHGIELCRALGQQGIDGLAGLYASLANSVRGNDPADAVRLCREGLAACADAPASLGQGRLLLAASRAYKYYGSPDMARPLCQQALGIAEQLGIQDLQASALCHLGGLPGQLFGEAWATSTKALALAESTGNLFTASEVNLQLGLLLEKTDVRTAREHYRRSFELFRQTGAASLPEVALGNIVFMSIWLGELREAEATLVMARQLVREVIEPGSLTTMVLGIVEAMLLVYLGTWGEAAPQLANCRAEAHRRENIDVLKFANEFLAFSWLESGILGDGVRAVDREETEVMLAEAIELAGRQQSGDLPRLRCQLCRLRANQGRFDEATAQLEQARVYVSSRWSVPSMPEAHLYEAEARLAAAQARWPQALSAFEAARDLYQELDLRWYSARIRIDWAAALLGRADPGDRGYARQLLQESLEMFQEMDAPGYVTAVATRLHSI